MSEPSPLRRRLHADLELRREHGRLRTPAPVPPGARVFCSNDYLGLAGNPQLRDEVARTLRTLGTGATGSRLISGSTALHERVEGELAAWLGKPAALLFPSGWQANTGLLASLARAGDTWFSDRLNHASLIDGMRMSRARRVVFEHNRVEHLDALLADAPGDGLRFVVTESIFSMDGDRAPLAELVEVCERHQAVLIVDEAHALGVVGPEGAGLVAELGLTDRVPVLLGTGGKSLGAAGGFVAGDALLRDWIWNEVRSFVYSTGVAPPVAAALHAALPRVRDGVARERLLRNLARLAEGLGLDRVPDSAIVPLHLGDEARALHVAEGLARRGFLVRAIRPPTVPVGTSRLRITASAAHALADIDAFCQALHETLRT